VASKSDEVAITTLDESNCRPPANVSQRLRGSAKPEVKAHCEAILKALRAAEGEEHAFTHPGMAHATSIS